MSFDELCIETAQMGEQSTEQESFTEYLKGIASASLATSSDIIQLSTVHAVSESTQSSTQYNYEFEEFKTDEQLQIEAQEIYEAYRI